MERDSFGVAIFIAMSVVILIFLAIIDYSFFHIIIELSTVFLGLIIYIIATYSSEYSKGSNLLFVGVAYLSIAIIDLMHLVNGGGFNILDINLNAATQLWLGARFIEAFVLYFAYSKLLKMRNLNFKVLIASFGFITLFVLSIVALESYLPSLYIVDSGYTIYKKIIDVVIIGFFIFAFRAVYKNESRHFNKKVLMVAIAFKIIAEAVYVFETGDESVLHVIRYISKFISYILLFLVFARDLLKRPYDNIFRAFKEKEEELTELSRKDSLTGLYNHSTSYEIMREIIKKNETDNNDVCLMMIDIDDFKCINDKYGHVKGDEILVQIGNMFKECDGPLKLAGRYGGDEFVVLFDNCDRNKAIKIAEKAFIKMEKISEKVGIIVTLSIGISEWKKGFTAKDLVRSADYQMYEAKSIGKSTYSINGKSE